MHTHTCFSDGDLTPNELVDYAKERNISVLSITDHDTLDGMKNLDNKSDNDIIIYPGIELTAKVNSGRMHILGYGIDINDKTLNNKLDKIKEDTLYSMMSYFNDLKVTYGMSFSSEDVRRILNLNSNVSRVDIAKLMIRYGYVKSIDEAFDMYLTEMYNRIRVHNSGVFYDECISLIKNAGGLSILAHPHTLLLDDCMLVKKIKELMECGLDGIEVYHSNHTLDEMKKYRKIADELNLLYSGGSDFHGEITKPDIEIGTGKNNNIHITELSLLKKLK